LRGKYTPAHDKRQEIRRPESFCIVFARKEGEYCIIVVEDVAMYILAPDEKATLAMAYTRNMLIRGEAVTKESMRVSVWLRTEGAPNYIHLLNANVIVFGGGTPKSLSYSEFYVPVQETLAFHIAPPQSDPLDYDPDEKNRSMDFVTILLGTFSMKGKIRFSSQTGMGASLEVARAAWMSLYEVDVSNPFLPQLSLHVPMMLVRPFNVGYGV